MLPQTSQFFFNTGLYNIGAGAYPIEDQGLWEVSLVDADKGRFRPPTLRNIAVTAPYMHDGRAGSIEAAILMHGGEAEPARKAYDALQSDEGAPLRLFLQSLGRPQKLEFKP